MTVQQTATADVPTPSLPGFLTDLRDDSPFVDPAALRNKMRPEIRFTIAVAVALLCNFSASAIIIMFDPGPLAGLGMSDDHLLWASVGFFGFVGLVATFFAMAAIGPTPILIAARYWGYLVTSWIAGARLEYWYVGPFGAVRHNNRLWLGLHRSRSLTRLGATGTIGGAEPYSRFWEIFRAAGPSACTFLLVPITGVLALVLFLPTRGNTFFAFVGSYSAIFFGSICVVAAITAIGDTVGFIRTVSNEQLPRLSYLRSVLYVAQVEGRVSDNADPDLLREVIEISDDDAVGPFMQAVTKRELVDYLLDRGDIERAHIQLEKLLSLIGQLPKPHQQSLLQGMLLGCYDAAALYYGLYARDPLSAFAWLSRANEDSVAPRPVRLESEAAALLASGHYAAARVRAQRALELAELPELPEMPVNRIQAIIHASEQSLAGQPEPESP